MTCGKQRDADGNGDWEGRRRWELRWYTGEEDPRGDAEGGEDDEDDGRRMEGRKGRGEMLSSSEDPAK